MYKKKDIIIILVLFIVSSVAIIFWIYNREYFTIGDSQASFDEESGNIFVALPEGSDEVQKISFNFPYKNKNIANALELLLKIGKKEILNILQKNNLPKL